MRRLGFVVSLLATAPLTRRVALVIGNSATAPQAVHFMVFDTCRSIGGIRASKGFVHVAEKPEPGGDPSSSGISFGGCPGMLIAFRSPMREVGMVASAET